jgi:hypothetical protein
MENNKCPNCGSFETKVVIERAQSDIHFSKPLKRDLVIQWRF